MQKFLEDTLESRYIKALLYNNFIPKYKSIREGDLIIEGITYVDNLNILRCTKTGHYLQDANYEVIGNYSLKDYSRKICQNFINRDRGYDSDTHKALGRYLRYYRDTTGIDLMPLYNCFSNSYLDGFTILSSGVEKKVNNLYKIIEVPIRFNETYTIAIDCPNLVSICSAFINHSELLYVDDNDLTEMLNVKVRQYPSLEFLSPITYSVESTDSYLNKFENYLTLLIQVPLSCDSSIVVLDGDYTDISQNNVSSVVNILSRKYRFTNSLFPQGRVKGDINGDGKIDYDDLTLLKNYLSGQATLNDIQRFCANVDGSLNVGTTDLTILDSVIKYINGDRSASIIDNVNTYKNNASDYYGNWTFDSESLSWYITNRYTYTSNLINILSDGLVRYEIKDSTRIMLYYLAPPPERIRLITYEYSDDTYTEDYSNNSNFSYLSNNLSLLKMNDKNSYAFSDKLILYLLNSVITNREEIPNNIGRVQSDLNTQNFTVPVDDIWNDDLRKTLFETYMSYNPNGYDILGYVDNDVEQFLLNLRSGNVSIS